MVVVCVAWAGDKLTRRADRFGRFGLGSQPIYEGQIAGDIRIGAITVNNPTIRFIRGGYPNVGLPLLRQMTLAFDPTNGSAPG